MQDDRLLDVENLRIVFTGDRPVIAADGISLTVRRGECLALVGESGAGKSATALAVAGLLGPRASVTAGGIRLDGADLALLPQKALDRVRGARIGFVFQEPAGAFNPVRTIGSQIGEALRIHRPMGRDEARAETLRWLARVSLAEPERVAAARPHELSGGMLQRALIAAALAPGPELLIADEPTTALDTTTQRQILELLRGLQRELRLGLLLITHDLGVVAAAADRVAVLYCGRVVETGPTPAVLGEPRHPYTRALRAAVPAEAPAGTGGRPRRFLTVPGSPPDPADRPAGCAFHPRCPEALPQCATEIPALDARGGAGSPGAVACHLFAIGGAPTA